MKLSRFYKFLHIIILSFVFFTLKIFAVENIDERVKKLTLELRCMTCQNQSIYESDSDFANDIKKLIKEKFEDGLSEKEIKLFLTERYGEYILFKPYFSTKNLLLWLFPFILVAISMCIFIGNLKKK